MYIAVTENQIIKGSLKKINKKLNSNIEKSEFKAVGKDYIVKLSDEDIDFIQDKKRLQAVAISKLFKRDNMQKYLIIAVLIFNALIFIRI